MMSWGGDTAVSRERYDKVVAQRDQNMRTVNRLLALIAKHDNKDFCDEADEELHAGYRKVLGDIAP